MGVLSKFCTSILGLTVYNASCHEFGHTWNPGCYGAIFEAFWQSCFFAFKTYALVYFLEAAVSCRRLSKETLMGLLKDISRSSLFLVVNVAAFLWFMCQFRRMLGFYVLPTMGLLNGTLASLLSILIESPRRRPMLALYLTNLASETAFRQLVNHGYLKFIPKGQVLLFSIGIAGFIYLWKRKQLSSRLSGLLKFTHCIQDEHEVVPIDKLRKRFPVIFRAAWFLRNNFGKHRLCQHPHSCLSRSLECFGRNFAIGFGLNLVLSAVQNFKKLVLKPLSFFRRLLSLRNLKLPLFLGTLPFIYQATRCLLNRVTNCEGGTVRDVLCGGLSGVAMLFYPSISIAMYILWKCIEAYYFHFAKCGHLPIVPHAAVALYALSTGYVLWNVVVEPKTLRRGYWDFLVDLTGHRVKLLNRRLFDRSCFRSSHTFTGFSFESPSS